jgi:fatty acid desaturase
MSVDQSAAPDTQRAISQEERLARARQQVAAIKGFYLHLFVFAAVVLGLAVINAVTRGRWWVQWVFLGWGIGVLAHALFVFVGGSRLVADWEQRKTRELADRM